MTKTSNLQDTVLSKARRSEMGVTVFLVNGFQIRGTIAAFDAFTVVVMSDGKQNLIYKHAISTISPNQPIELREAEEAGKDLP